MNDEKGRPMTYWGGKVSSEKPQRIEALYEWLAPKLSTEERKALDAIYAAVSATGECIYICRARDGEPYAAWCKAHGFDCPNNRPVDSTNDSKGQG